MFDLVINRNCTCSRCAVIKEKKKKLKILIKLYKLFVLIKNLLLSCHKIIAIEIIYSIILKLFINFVVLFWLICKSINAKILICCLHLLITKKTDICVIFSFKIKKKKNVLFCVFYLLVYFTFYTLD